MTIKELLSNLTVEEITVILQLFAMFLGVQFGSAVLICISSILSHFTNKNIYDLFIMQRRARRIKKRREELERAGLIRDEWGNSKNE